MVTTRSRDSKRATLPSPAANIRKRFNNEEPEDTIVVEIPLRSLVDPNKAGQSDEIKARNVKDTGEDDEDDDESPEIISSKDAAKHARGLANRSLPRQGNKRRKLGMDHSNDEGPSTQPPGAPSTRFEDSNLEVSESTLAEEDLKPLDSVALETEPPAAGNMLTLSEDSTALAPNTQQDGPITAENPQISIERAPFLEDLVTNEEEESKADTLLYEIATEAVVVGGPPSEQPQEPDQKTTGNLKSLKDASAHQDALKQERHLAGKPELNHPAEFTISTPTSRPDETSHEHKAQDMFEERDSGLLMTITPSLPAAKGTETTEKDIQLPATTADVDIQMYETPKSTTSSVITPIWQSRTHDSTPTLTTNTTAAMFNSSEPRPNATLSLRQRQTLFSRSKPKPSSLQQYRNRLLNRHARTANWGPAGFQSPRFVGA